MLSFLDGGGVQAEAILSHDWTDNALGNPGAWPVTLKTTVGLVLASRFPQCIIWGPSLITIPNQAFVPILGDKPDALGRPFNEVWSEVWPSLAPIVDQAFAGQATYIDEFPLTIDRHGYPEKAYFTFCYSPIRDDRGQVVGMLDTVTETTKQVELREQQAIRAGELDHRLKNLLSVVQAVANQTLRQSQSLEAASEALGLRLAAFGRAADVLTASRWEDADLRQLVMTALSPHIDFQERIHLLGAPLKLKAQPALALTLALHELATNAIKYGSLSDDKGVIDVKWSVYIDPERKGERLKFVWQESGGPRVTPPSRRGFGSLMIERSLKSYFRGDLTLEYRSEGLAFLLDAPLAGVRATD